MTRAAERTPAGYRAFRLEGATIVALDAMGDAVRETLASGSLYEFAAAHPRARALSGRGISYAIPLPGGVADVVVRRSRHGGLFAPLTGDLFLPPTRAPYELRTAVRLRESGVRTPEIVAYVVYRAAAVLRRSDVATRDVPHSCDLAQALLAAADAGRKADSLAATRTLLATLLRAGAHHPDLNLKNVLLAPEAPRGHRQVAWVLDVDRVTFATPGDPRIWRENLRRLTRSARKWRTLHGAAIQDGDLDWEMP